MSNLGTEIDPPDAMRLLDKIQARQHGTQVRFDSLKEGATFSIYYAGFIRKRFQRLTVEGAGVKCNAVLLDKPDDKNPVFQYFEPNTTVHI